jgi:hypothetical protein
LFLGSSSYIALFFIFVSHFSILFSLFTFSFAWFLFLTFASYFSYLSQFLLLIFLLTLIVSNSCFKSWFKLSFLIQILLLASYIKVPFYSSSSFSLLALACILACIGCIIFVDKYFPPTFFLHVQDSKANLGWKSSF